MRRGPRGGPGDVAVRLARAEELLVEVTGAAHGPLALLVAVLRHQLDRMTDGEALVAKPATGAAGSRGRPTGPERAPARPAAPPREPVVLDAPTVWSEMARARDALVGIAPAPLADAAGRLRALDVAERAPLIESWLEEPAAVDPRVGFWVQVAAGPLFERAAVAATLPADWRGSACPVCGARPQASVIAEESGEFMAGSPRSLVCGRCATWWSFTRATCVTCHQEDPRQLDSFLEDERRWVRVDLCSTCRSYVKTFDLRQPGARDVVPLVDDVATLTLDVWAQQHGYTRPSLSLAGV